MSGFISASVWGKCDSLWQGKRDPPYDPPHETFKPLPRSVPFQLNGCRSPSPAKVGCQPNLKVYEADQSDTKPRDIQRLDDLILAHLRNEGPNEKQGQEDRFASNFIEVARTVGVWRAHAHPWVTNRENPRRKRNCSDKSQIQPGLPR